MSKYYFYDTDSELCYSKESIIDMIKHDGLTEKEVFEAEITYGEDFMYCKYHGQVGEKGHCGKSCEQYKPRNKISGNCIHTGVLYEKGNKITFKL